MTPPIDAISLAVGAAALLVALAALGHAWLRRRIEDEPAASASAIGLALGALAMAVATLIALAVARQPGAAAIAAALVPLAGLPALFPERARAWPGASAPIVTAALAAALGGALPLIADFQADQPDPRLARVGLVLLLLHVGLVAAIVPVHLWALGLAERVPTASLGVLLAFGDLAGLAALVAALASYPWLLGVVGTRALLTAVGAAALALPLIGLAGETRPRRAILLVGQLPAAAAWLTLASGAADGTAAAVALLLARALGLATALLALDAIEREQALSWRTTHRRRLLGPARLSLWVGLATLVGLPPTLGFAGGRAALAALVPERPDVALTLLAAAGLTLLAARRVPVALLVGVAEGASGELAAPGGGAGDAGAAGDGPGESLGQDAPGATSSAGGAPTASLLPRAPGATSSGGGAPTASLLPLGEGQDEGVQMGAGQPTAAAGPRPHPVPLPEGEGTRVELPGSISAAGGPASAGDAAEESASASERPDVEGSRPPGAAGEPLSDSAQPRPASTGRADLADSAPEPSAEPDASGERAEAAYASGEHAERADSSGDRSEGADASDERAVAPDASDERGDDADTSSEGAERTASPSERADDAAASGTATDGRSGVAAEPDRFDADRPDDERVDLDRPDDHRVDLDRPDDHRVDPDRPDDHRVDPDRPAAGPERAEAALRPSEWRSAAAPLALAAVSLALGLAGDALLASLRAAVGRLGGG